MSSGDLGGLAVKVTEFLEDVGRPVAYYPSFARMLGSVTAALFICQLIYWTGKEKGADGWIYKEAVEIERETGLSWKQQKTARNILIRAGVLQERADRVRHRIYFRVKKEEFNKAWEAFRKRQQVAA
jgi:hypothetical protein